MNTLFNICLEKLSKYIFNQALIIAKNEETPNSNFYRNLQRSTDRIIFSNSFGYLPRHIDRLLIYHVILEEEAYLLENDYECDDLRYEANHHALYY